jgi:hypothetical protein
MTDRMTKQMEVVYKELLTKHGVALLSKQAGSNELEMIIVETPVGHTSHHRTQIVEAKPKYIAPVKFGRDENAVVHQLVKKMQLATNV